MLFTGFTVELGLTDKLLIHLPLVLIPFISCAVEQLGPGLVDRHSLVLLGLDSESRNSNGEGGGKGHQNWLVVESP